MVGNKSGKRISCKIWCSMSQTVSDLGNIYDRSIPAFAVKPRAFGAPQIAFRDEMSTLHAQSRSSRVPEQAS
jgi:hypothetical protein